MLNVVAKGGTDQLPQVFSGPSAAGRSPSGHLTYCDAFGRKVRLTAPESRNAAPAPDRKRRLEANVPVFAMW
jgi:hypothetical protein